MSDESSKSGRHRRDFGKVVETANANSNSNSTDSPTGVSTQNPSISTDLPPPRGWRNDTAMHLEDDWESNVSRGSEVALTYGIDGPGRPLLEDENGQFQIFQAGDTFFMWEMRTDVIYEFACQDIHVLYHTLEHEGLRAVEKWRLDIPLN